jgi:hypothetical protein
MTTPSPDDVSALVLADIDSWLTDHAMWSNAEVPRPGIKRLLRDCKECIAALRLELDAANKAGAAALIDVQQLRLVLNPRFWTRQQNDAWHRNIPNMQKAFDALRDAALSAPERGG